MQTVALLKKIEGDAEVKVQRKNKRLEKAKTFESQDPKNDTNAPSYGNVETPWVN